MTPYTTITIIYNPNSTGKSEETAKKTAEQLRAAVSGTAVDTVATERAGHAEELAYSLSKASTRPLIISASGDGGYSEVINGALRAKHDGAHPTTGLLPTGNANDHYNALHTDDFVDSVVHGKEQVIDILSLTAHTPDRTVTRYAHSYIGLGITPEVGHELNKTQLNRIKEAWIAGKSFLAFEHVAIRVEGKLRRYHNLVFSNIHRMAKVLTLAKDALPNDGLFEVSAVPYRSKLDAALSLLKASAQGEFDTRQVRAYSFQTIERTRVQLDGEIITLPPRSNVTVGIEPMAMSCIV